MQLNLGTTKATLLKKDELDVYLVSNIMHLNKNTAKSVSYLNLLCEMNKEENLSALKNNITFQPLSSILSVVTSHQYLLIFFLISLTLLKFKCKKLSF